MTPYQNRGGNSGVSAYEIGSDSITVQFKEGKDRFYRYTNASAGSQSVESMKQLAANGVGLNSFISSNPAVRNGYESKW